MLVLCRRQGEELIINQNIQIRVLEVTRGRVRLGIEAPRDVHVLRAELVKPLQIRKPLPES